MSKIGDDIQELREEFEGIDRAIIDGAKNMRTMQATLSRTNAIMGSKNWEVFSRFISGTGLWRVQNRIKATVILLNEMASSTERRRLEEVKQLKVYAEIADQAEEIQKIQANIELAEKSTGEDREKAIEAIRKQSKIFGGLLFQHQDQNKALREMSKLMDKQVKDIEKLEKAATKGARRRKEGLIANSLTVKLTNDIAEGTKKAFEFTKNKVTSQKHVVAATKKANELAEAASKKLSPLFSPVAAVQAKFDEMGVTGKEKSKMARGSDARSRFQIGNKFLKDEEGKEKVRHFRRLKVLMKVAKATEATGKGIRYASTPLTNLMKFTGRIAKGIMSIVRTMFMAAGYLLLIMLGLTLLRKVFTENKEAFIAGFEKMKETFSVGLAIVATGIGGFKTALENIWAAFQSNNLIGVVAGVGQLVVAGLQILAGLLVATIGTVIMGAVEFIRNVFNTKLDELTGGLAATREQIVAAGLHVVKVLAMIVAGIALVGVLIFGLPALLIAGFAGLIYILADKLIPHADKIASVLGFIYDTFVDVKSFLVDKLNIPTLAEIKTALKEALSPEAIEKVGDGINKVGNSIKGMLGFAQGGIVPRSGFHMVGEQGPELVRLPQGSRVYNNSDTRSMMGGGSVTNNITVQVTGRVGANDAEIRDIANKVAREINSRMNRTTTSVVKF